MHDEPNNQFSKQKKDFLIIAIIAAHNEDDIIYHVIGDLIKQNINVYFIDHCSTDNTVKEASRWLGKGLIQIEHFPEDAGYAEENKTRYRWRDILKRKEELALSLNADWFIHHDADEFRESPWPDLSLYEAIKAVDNLGYNAIDFKILNFRPIDNSFQVGNDVRESLKYFEWGEETNKTQTKVWKKQLVKVDLESSGGHEARFKERQVFPIQFVLRHYPVRSQSHGEKKVFKERQQRFEKIERDDGWHVQYDDFFKGHNFLYDKESLMLYNANAVKLQVLSSARDAIMPLNIWEQTSLRDDYVRDLENRISLLQSMDSSHGWKVLMKYYRMRNKCRKFLGAYKKDHAKGL